MLWLVLFAMKFSLIRNPFYRRRDFDEICKPAKDNNDNIPELI